MKENLNYEVIQVMKARLLEDRNVVDVLMDILSIGKEAAYRRMRGEVPFSFYEMAYISKALGLSMDEIAGNAVANEAVFSLNLRNAKDPFEYFTIICNGYLDIYTYLSGNPTSRISAAANMLPFMYHTQYETLTKFRLCRWLHQFQGDNIPEKMINIHIPDKLKTKFSELSNILRTIPMTCLIWDTTVFSSIIKDIAFFVGLGLISAEEVNIIKKELLQLLNEMEEIAYRGAYPNGNKINIYLSGVHLEACYAYMEKTDFQLSIFHMYAIDYTHSAHPDVCEAQKKWIESLSRYATLISLCGERQRIAFFEKQREQVMVL